VPTVYLFQVLNNNKIEILYTKNIYSKVLIRSPLRRTNSGLNNESVLKAKPIYIEIDCIGLKYVVLKEEQSYSQLVLIQEHYCNTFNMFYLLRK